MRICLASAERDNLLDTLQRAEVRSILVSFYYIGQFGRERLHEYLDRWAEFEFVFLDSGAHSFHAEHGLIPGFEKGTKTDPDEFARRFIDFVAEYGERFDVIAELDIGEIVGAEKVKEWREALVEAAGVDKILPVFHREYITMVEMEGEIFGRYPYCAVDGRQTDRFYRSFVRKAVRAGSKVHGFALIKPELLRKVAFSSVDSNSWLAERYGQLAVFHRGKIVMAGGRGAVKSLNRYMNRLRALGVDIDKVKAGDTDEFCFANAIAYRQLEDFLTEKHSKSTPDDSQAEFYEQGLGKGGMPPPIKKGDHHTEETKLKISESMQGKMNAFKHGKYTDRLPSLRCCTCEIKDTCAESKEGSVCHFADEFRLLAERAGTRDVQALLDIEWALFQSDLVRYSRNLQFETEDGGLIDKNVSMLSKQISQRADNLLAMQGMADRIGAQTGQYEQGILLKEQTILELAKSLEEPGEIVALIERRRELIRIDRRILEERGIYLGGTAGSSARGKVVAETELDTPPTIEGQYREVEGEEGGD